MASFFSFSLILHIDIRGMAQSFQLSTSDVVPLPPTQYPESPALINTPLRYPYVVPREQS